MGNNQCCDHAIANDFQPMYLNNKSKNHQQNVQDNKNQQLLGVVSKIHLNPKQNQKQQSDRKPNIQVLYTTPSIPQLSPEIQKHLQTNKYFQENFNFQPQIKQFHQEIYCGQLSKLNNKPQGYGKMYKSDGSLFIGRFIQGKAEGQGVYIMADGSYYIGDFHDNQAEGFGKFYSKQFEYQGNFKNNAFEGKGSQKSLVHQFSGQYHKGVKSKGVYKWRDQQNNQYQYTGEFNSQNLFHGRGILQQPTGTYTGEFVNGLKHGKGVYKYQNGLSYEGQYSQGQKCGIGILYNFGGAIAYQGQFKNDLPHGKGFVCSQKKEKVQSNWVYGIDSVFL